MDQRTALRFWIEQTLECIRRDHTDSFSMGDQRGPFLTARALGMAVGALRDAWLGAGPGGPALLPVPWTGPAGAANPVRLIAAGAACHRVLRNRYPKQVASIDAAFLLWLSLSESVTVLNAPATSAGALAAQAAGRAFGKAVHDFGANDPADAALDQYFPSFEPYEHRVPDNEPGQHYAGAKWGDAPHLFLVPGHLPLSPPPGRTGATTVIPSVHFQMDFDRTKAKGYDDRTAGRTADEEMIGIFWGYDGPPELGTPPRLYMQVVLQVLDEERARPAPALGVDEELTVIAGCAVAMADAGIEAWHYKYLPTHMMWRPSVGIRHAVPGNGVAVPDWLPLGRPDTNSTKINPAVVRIPGTGLTPDFPAYPSGHATFGAAAFHLLRLFLVDKGRASFKPHGRDTVGFTFVSDEFNGRNTDPRFPSTPPHHPRPFHKQHFASLWEAIVANSVSRLFLGVHWQFDGITKRNAAGTDDDFADNVFGLEPDALGHTGGVWLGAQIANLVAKRINVSQPTINKGKI